LERKKILGQPSCIDNNMAAFVLDQSRADVRFVHTLLLSKKLGSLVATTALPALNGKQLGEMILTLPPLPEQRAIATVLTEMDRELAVLTQRRDKTRALKQAMMQELLTGRTRLI
jgi:type I restriction enzyme S subunit